VGGYTWKELHADVEAGVTCGRYGGDHTACVPYLRAFMF
jgi:hypothetical protein